MTSTISQTPPKRVGAPPYRLAGLALLLVLATVLGMAWGEFRGFFDSKSTLFLTADRSGLTLDPGSKVTFNGVPVGRLKSVHAETRGGQSGAKLLLEVEPHYLDMMPANVEADLRATTVFGNKFVSLLTPKSPSPDKLKPGATLTAGSTTTEFNTLFETIMSIAAQVDPVKLNLTLTAAAQALDGLGDKFGRSLVDGNSILRELNPRMPQIREDIEGLADLSNVYVKSAPNLFDALSFATTTAHTLHEEWGDVNGALLAAIGFGKNAHDVLDRSGSYFIRGAQDLVPTSEIFDYFSPEILCTLRNFHDVAPSLADMIGGNGFSIRTNSELIGAGNPYVYPDNLPRTNASGGPGGRPGCWQPITRNLWPAPYLVMDTGASIAPYNHFEPGQPLATEYIWGRQAGEHTINP